MKGYLRKDGRKGIRNVVVVTYLVECAHHVASRIAQHFQDDDVHLIGFSGCAPNDYAELMMRQLCTHPNVGAVLLVSLGCENFQRNRLLKDIKESGRPASLIVIQEEGGTMPSIQKGISIINSLLEQRQTVPVVNIQWSNLVIGTVCGGSDGYSGITANPAVGCTFDYLIDQGATCIFEEPGELIGCEQLLQDRAVTPELGVQLYNCIVKANNYYKQMGHDSFSAGNATGGLTTIEEKSLGSYCKSGSRPIQGLTYPGIRPISAGLWMMDVVPDGEARWGFPNINDNAEIMEMIACGCHLVLYTTGRGSVAGSAISPVVKVCSNPITYQQMVDDMDINAGAIVTDGQSFNDVRDLLLQCIEKTASGVPTKSELLGHREYSLVYKSFKKICI
ncbi:altronate hydrolase [Prevotella sp. tc2-28]|uniref:UxaA family hydrolase n=1 Tax=Prevotella sp. tc2-28 TaxID=1761888 RepID=UPI000895F2D0|nr:UxaA family hydrolase [Prevotella sp. tc2-28]SEA11426.1 altronate hydrolase [Prevotella sp. tc2-28]